MPLIDDTTTTRRRTDAAKAVGVARDRPETP